MNATKGYAYEDSNGRYDDNDPERWRAAAIVLGCLVGVALIGLVALAVVVWKMKKGAAETGNGERAEEEQQQQQVNNEQTAADMEQNVTPQDIIAPE